MSIQSFMKKKLCGFGHHLVECIKAGIVRMGPFVPEAEDSGCIIKTNTNTKLGTSPHPEEESLPVRTRQRMEELQDG